MLTSTIDFSDANDYLSENMKKAIAFLRDNDLDALPLGRTEIKGDDVFANVMEYETVDADEKDMEAHKLYYDVQFVVRGEEALYVAPPRRAQRDATLRRRKRFRALFDSRLRQPYLSTRRRACNRGTRRRS